MEHARRRPQWFGLDWLLTVAVLAVLTVWAVSRLRWMASAYDAATVASVVVASVSVGRMVWSRVTDQASVRTPLLVAVVAMAAVAVLALVGPTVSCVDGSAYVVAGCA